MTTTLYPPDELQEELRSLLPPTVRPGAIGGVPLRATNRSTTQKPVDRPNPDRPNPDRANTDRANTDRPNPDRAKTGRPIRERPDSMVDVAPPLVRLRVNRANRGAAMDPRIARRRFDVRTSEQSVRRRRDARHLTAALVVCAIAVLLFTPVIGVRRIDVTGVTSAGEQARLRDESGVRTGTPLIRISTGSVRRRIESLPDIASAKVTKHWFRELTIDVVPERAVGVILGRTNTAVVGENGVVIRSVPSSQLGEYSLLPRLQGIAPAEVGEALVGHGARGAATAAALEPVTRSLGQSVAFKDGGVVVALRDIPGPVGARRVGQAFEAVFGSHADIALKARALEALLTSGSLNGHTAVDLGVPDAPILK